MAKVSKMISAVIGLGMLVGYASADCYLHNPPGSNDRNRERNENRNNGNRLFDSQNNDKGGYPWRGNRELRNQPDPSTYYEGSNMVMEWTLQHACGLNPSTHCDVVVQYACEDTLPNLRDGYPSGGTTNADGNNGDYNPPYLRAQFNDNNNDGTNTISENTKDNTEYGQHESFELYDQLCVNTERNKGLFTADQTLNRQDARATRQNPNGNRNGFECAEERDYYPYWNPTVWRDAAVLTSNADWCDYFTSNSQNTVDRYMCTGANGNRQPINQQECQANGGTWRNTGNFGMDAPTCHVHAASRQNHLGNSDPLPNEPSELDTKDVGGGSASTYIFSMPSVSSLNGAAHPYLTNTNIYDSASTVCANADECTCILRVRYNISTADYNSVGAYTGSAFTDSAINCEGVQQGNQENVDDAATGANGNENCYNTLENGNRPLYNRPYVQAFNSDEAKLSIALNTDQSGRTFQDRTHVFKVAKRPSGVGGTTIWNVNTRGRRGNIVQSYPAVEYGFYPSMVTAAQGDLMHFQFHGSDFNAARNPNNGEGWQYSDRSNLVQMESANYQFPMDWSTGSNKFFDGYDQALEFALLDSKANLNAENEDCEEFEAGDDNENNDPQNCGKLNYASATWQPSSKTTGSGATGLIGVNHDREKYYFVSTRNNNFSNRSQKFMIQVTGLKDWEIAVISISAVMAVLAPIGGFLFWAMYMKQMSFNDACMTYCCCCFAGVAMFKAGSTGKTKKKKKKTKKTTFDDVVMDENNQA